MDATKCLWWSIRIASDDGRAFLMTLFRLINVEEAASGERHLARDDKSPILRGDFWRHLIANSNRVECTAETFESATFR